jgi:hypothetical protein
MMEASPCPNQVIDKDLLESDRLKAVVNLQKYRAEMKAWRNPKVKPRGFDVGNLVLLRSPSTESSLKLESKWARLYAVMEKSRLGAYRLSDVQGKILVVFAFKKVV